MVRLRGEAELSQLITPPLHERRMNWVLTLLLLLLFCTCGWKAAAESCREQQVVKKRVKRVKNVVEFVIASHATRTH